MDFSIISNLRDHKFFRWLGWRLGQKIQKLRQKYLVIPQNQEVLKTLNKMGIEVWLSSWVFPAVPEGLSWLSTPMLHLVTQAPVYLTSSYLFSHLQKLQKLAQVHTLPHKHACIHTIKNKKKSFGGIAASKGGPNPENWNNLSRVVFINQSRKLQPHVGKIVYMFIQVCLSYWELINGIVSNLSDWIINELYRFNMLHKGETNLHIHEL